MRLKLRSALHHVSLATLLLSATPSWSDEASGWTHIFNEAISSDTTGLSYQTHWDSLSLPGTTEVADATISSTSYFLETETASPDRPVVFLFNGGPGASSSPLHFALGPNLRIRNEETGETDFPANPDTLLDLADLVFIDPVETGFSRATSDPALRTWLNTDGDAEATSLFIHGWLSAHKRTGAPVFIIGQSYGGFRLSKLLPLIGDLNIDGLAMISPALDMGLGATDLANVFNLPTYAATAWRFGRSSIEAASEEEAWNKARAFAETDYLIALQKGDALDAALKDEMASELATMTGLSADNIREYDIRIPVQYFLENVLADENKLVSRLNTGVAVVKKPPANADRPAGANDPSLGLGTSNKILADDIATYLKDLTGVEGSDGYRSLNLDANFMWNWSGNTTGYAPVLDASPLIGPFLNAHPETKLHVFGGYRDLAVSLSGLQYTLSHSGLPEDQVTLHRMLSGHSPYAEDGLKQPFASILRTLITETITDTQGSGND